MKLLMAGTAKGDEILFLIPSQLTSRLHMMNLKFLGTSASLASPGITLEHLPAKHSIGVPVQAKPRMSSDG